MLIWATIYLILGIITILYLPDKINQIIEYIDDYDDIFDSKQEKLDIVEFLEGTIDDLEDYNILSMIKNIIIFPYYIFVTLPFII